MNCDRCNGPTHQVYLAAGIPDGQLWCLTCCDALGVKLGNVRNYQPASSGNEIRDRWLAEQAAKTRTRVEKIRAAKGLEPFYKEEDAA